MSVQVRMHSQGVEFGVHTILHISFWQVLEGLYQSNIATTIPVNQEKCMLLAKPI